MILYPVLAEKLSAALADATPVGFTRRDVRLPVVPGKAHAVIGLRRADCLPVEEGCAPGEAIFAPRTFTEKKAQKRLLG